MKAETMVAIFGFVIGIYGAVILYGKLGGSTTIALLLLMWGNNCVQRRVTRNSDESR